MSTDDVSRRRFVRTAAGATAAAGVGVGTTGTVAAQEEPDFDGYLDGVDGGYEDLRGQEEVTVMVGAEGNGGNLAFSPAGIWIDEGTTVTFEWTGEGGAHNVVADAQDTPFENDHPDLDSGSAVDEAGYTYEYTFEEPGRTGYVCEPHRAVDMFGAVAVGDGAPTIDTGDDGAEGVVFVPDGALSLGIATFIAMVGTLGLAFVFMKYGGTTPVEDTE